MVLFSVTIWKNLSPEILHFFEEAAAESVEFQRKLWQEQNEESLRELEKACVLIHRPDTKPFQEKVRPMYEKLDGTSIGALVGRVRAVN
jgi:TRAP-type C4-dicarboxylate transport system substrate-binding protein